MTATITPRMASELAAAEGVCVRPVIRRVIDRETGAEQTVGMACGATLDSRCPSCARKARTLRMHQCAEGWHLSEEPTREPAAPRNPESSTNARRVRSTRRRDDLPSLPERPMEERTVGASFQAPDGRSYRPSMFLTLTLPSYGQVTPGTGTPADPSRYDYRRAALDALFFPRLVDQFWKVLRRCAGFDVQYFSAVEPQKRLAPHLHAAIRGAIPREVLRQVARAVYVSVWWPPFTEAVYTNRPPVWTDAGYADPETGELLPTWDEAMDALDADEDARPAHVMRFGTQLDMRGIVAPSAEADRAVRYLVKYLNKSVAEPFVDDDRLDARYQAHIDRLHAELRWLPCSESCANWLRFGIQPANARAGLTPGSCQKKHHDREHLGLGGRRCLVSWKWSGKTLSRHRADRADVVRQALQEAGITPPEIERLAADVKTADGRPRYDWQPVEQNPGVYCRTILRGVSERRRWRAEYEHAKTALAPVDSNSAVPP